MKLYKIKRGDTFKFNRSWLTDKTGAIIPLAGYEITCQIRDINSVLISTLTITIVADEFESDNIDTATWPVVDLYCDLSFKKNAKIVSSETFTIRVEKDITQP